MLGSATMLETTQCLGGKSIGNKIHADRKDRTLCMREWKARNSPRKDIACCGIAARKRRNKTANRDNDNCNGPMRLWKSCRLQDGGPFAVPRLRARQVNVYW